MGAALQELIAFVVEIGGHNDKLFHSLEYDSSDTRNVIIYFSGMLGWIFLLVLPAEVRSHPDLSFSSQT